MHVFIHTCKHTETFASLVSINDTHTHTQIDFAYIHIHIHASRQSAALQRAPSMTNTYMFPSYGILTYVCIHTHTHIHASRQRLSPALSASSAPQRAPSMPQNPASDSELQRQVQEERALRQNAEMECDRYVYVYAYMHVCVCVCVWMCV
jgi:hypothetical protein